MGALRTLQISALGRSKAAHEFLVLHYYALDSAKHWDEVLLHVVPTVRLPGAKARRAAALEAFGASHIPPSHRRMPHVLWTDAMTLIWNLLIGGRMGRCTGSPAEAFRRAVFAGLSYPDLQRFRLLGIHSARGLSTQQVLWHPSYMFLGGRTLYKVSGSGRMESWKSSLAMFPFCFPTVLPKYINVGILSRFLTPLIATGASALNLRMTLNGDQLTLDLVECLCGFFVQISITGLDELI